MMSSSLQFLLKNISGISEDIPADILVNEISLDSRAIESGMLFVALKGTQTHGLEYAQKAQEQGAVAVIWESDDLSSVSALLSTLSIPVIEIQGLSRQLGEIARCFYQLLNDKKKQAENYGLTLIGVTGTDGKTTVSHFFAQAMNALNKTTAVIGTLGVGLPSNLKASTHTTPDVLTIHKTLRDIAVMGAKFVAMEVSSHALDQERVNGVVFDVAILTNLMRDHLDYHGTVEAYGKAKKKLFLHPELKIAALNREDSFSREVEQDLIANTELGIISYRVESHQSDVRKANELVAYDAQFTSEGIEAKVVLGDEEGVIKAPVLGWFNLSNLLATLAAMLALDVKFSDAVNSLSQVTTVPGRMERIASDNTLVVVDYAHTPGALESVLKALRGHTNKRVICVFGCGGDRDRGKRPLMAAIAEQGADIIIVTDDNPRTENPKIIMDEIIAGFEQIEKITIEHDRAKAIRLALQQAQAGDVVLIAGKGHEQVQILAHTVEPFDDRQQATQAVQELVA